MVLADPTQRQLQQDADLEKKVIFIVVKLAAFEQQINLAIPRCEHRPKGDRNSAIDSSTLGTISCRQTDLPSLADEEDEAVHGEEIVEVS